MEIKKITVEQFEELVLSSSRRAPYGQNQMLLKDAEQTPVVLSFENEKKAVSKLTALYVVRRKSQAQVKIVRQGANLILGPGKYVPSIRRNRKK